MRPTIDNKPFDSNLTSEVNTGQNARIVILVLENCGWEPSDTATTAPSAPHKQPRQNPYQQNPMDWGLNEDNASGSSAIQNRSELNYDETIEQESFDRLVLLAKKYASEKVKLTNEDDARLEMINQNMDRSYPRYTAKDWELIDEAYSLIDELSNL